MFRKTIIKYLRWNFTAWGKPGRDKSVLGTVFMFIDQWLLQKAFCNTVLLVVDKDGEIAH